MVDIRIRWMLACGLVCQIEARTSYLRLIFFDVISTTRPPSRKPREKDLIFTKTVYNCFVAEFQDEEVNQRKDTTTVFVK
ncbi:hypothetical protein F4779DRAFT_190852 [Xylariaceae sp. FL0662B]|nr:hypothetical protein F4779DRAFT_190852 [Xylariaceae sp. FL0662B]